MKFAQTNSILEVFCTLLSSNLNKQKFQLFPGGSEKSRHGQSTRVFDYKGTLLVDSLPFGQLILDENILIIAHNVTQGRFLKILKRFFLTFKLFDADKLSFDYMF